MSNLLAKELRRSKYRLLGLVGQGQFGRVYCAIHRRTGRLVALKELGRDRLSTNKFLRELRFLLSLQHENIVTCYAMEQTASGRYLVMDYCEGGTLRGLLAEDVQLQPILALKLVGQILAGLDHAHQRGIVHCDVKPENILLKVTEDSWTAQISDFGIARLSQEMTNAGFNNTGSPAYMAPERFYGQYSPASDLYAIGILLFEMLVGHRPFSGQPGELMSVHLNQAVVIPAAVPSELQAIIGTALQKLPARRFRSAREMLEQVQFAIASLELLSQRSTEQVLVNQLLVNQPAACAFQFTYQEILQLPIRQIERGYGQDLQSLKQALSFFRVAGDRVEQQTYRVEPSDIDPSNLEPSDIDPSVKASNVEPVPTDEANRHIPLKEVRLQRPILALVVQPQGCFAITCRSIDWISNADLGVGAVSANPLEPELLAAGETFSLHLVEEPNSVEESNHVFDEAVKVAINPQGRWFAAAMQQTATQELQTPGSRVDLWNLQPLKLNTSFYTFPCAQILALDSRHLAVFSHSIDAPCGSTKGTVMQVFSRRGSAMGVFELPIALHQITPGSTPYRFVAIEPAHPNSVLLLDLKPLRIQRVGLGVRPLLLATTGWGWVLMSQAGEIVLLNQYGQIIGQIAGPAHPTTIVALDPYRLAIATWSNETGSLYIVDLRQLDLDVLF